MSYQVFARKYRPQTFDEVVGQEHITQTLKNAIEQNRLAHAYLFVGPRGTGKTSTARILAKALNCEKGPTISPCGVCPVCRDIAAGTSFNVLEFDAASNTQVEKVRELIIENVKYRPTIGKYKIYIVDEIHMLSTNSFNALLKTLEEPPEHVIFVFATTNVEKLPVTILSRCQRFDLRRIPAPLIAKHLQFIAQNEKIALAESAAHTIAKGAEGGLRDAESMLDQLVAFCGDSISEEDVLKIFGFTAAQTVSDLCGFILAGDNPGALAAVQQQAAQGKDLSRLMADLIAHLRDLIVAKADPESIRGEMPPELFDALTAQAGKLAMDRLLELIEQFAQAETRMKWAPNKKLHFEIAVIKAVQTLGTATLTEVIDTLAALRGGADVPLPSPRSGGPPVAADFAKPAARKMSAAPDPQKTSPAAEPAPAQASELAPPPPNAAKIARVVSPESFWLELISTVRERRPLISSYIETGSLLELGSAAVTIGFPTDQRIAMEALQRPNTRAFLETLFAELTGETPVLKCELRAGLTITPAEVPEPVPAPPADPMDAFKNDPLIRKALELFQAEIQPA